MRHASAILAAGILAALATAAAAETLTSRILEWSPADRTVTFEDLRQMQLDPELQIDNLQAGDEVTVMFNTDADGIERIYDFSYVEPLEYDSGEIVIDN